MFLDSSAVPEGAELECDLCVVGAGAAGITIARELADSHLNVCVLESGGFDPDPHVEALYRGKVVGRSYSLTGTRLRYFGGTTNHWFGWCRPLDDIDFRDREGIPSSAWPLTRAELEPYYRRAHRICQLGPFTYDAGIWAGKTGTRPFRLGRDVESRILQLSPPTRFGRVYRDDLRRSRAVRVVLDANLVKIELAPGGAAVERAHASTLDGKRFTVRPRQLVMAAGAIENARLLLASHDVQPTGVGNGNDLVGRFFSDHLQAPVGTVALPTRASVSAFYDAVATARPSPVRGHLATTDRFVRSEGLLRFSAFIQLFTPPSLTLGREVGSVMQAIEGREVDRFRVLHMVAEPAPNPDNRVTLTRAVDTLGVPKVRLTWRPTELDRVSARRSLDTIAAALGAAGIARVNNQMLINDDFWSTVTGSAHHLGTTRMNRDPRHGVVDENCRVHGVSNLYVAGSAVFPRGGIANPTLTIVALAIRLAEHLKAGLR